MFESNTDEPSLTWVISEDSDDPVQEDKTAKILADKELNVLLRQLSPGMLTRVRQLLMDADTVAETATSERMPVIRKDIAKRIFAVLAQGKTEQEDRINTARKILNKTLAEKIAFQWRVAWADNFPKK